MERSEAEQRMNGNVSLRAAARMVGVSPHTLRTWAVYQHRLGFYRMGRRLLFAPADLEAFVALHRVAARDEPHNGAGPGGGGVPGHRDTARGAPFAGRVRRAR
jgi:excisionase family DNA binding protein